MSLKSFVDGLRGKKEQDEHAANAKELIESLSEAERAAVLQVLQPQAQPEEATKAEATPTPEVKAEEPQVTEESKPEPAVPAAESIVPPPSTSQTLTQSGLTDEGIARMSKEEINSNWALIEQHITTNYPNGFTT